LGFRYRGIRIGDSEWAYFLALPTLFGILTKKFIALFQYGGGVLTFVKITPSQVINNAHNLFPFDQTPDFRLATVREAKEVCLSGALFYPGSSQELVNYLSDLLSSHAVLSPFEKGSRIELKETNLGLIESARMIWNNRAVFDVYFNNEFIRQATCFAVKKEDFKPPFFEKGRLLENFKNLLT
jgi:hypothetical protein